MIQTLFDRVYSRSFALDMLMDTQDIIYIHDSDKRVISTFGNGFISSLATANNNKFSWHVAPDDVWLFALHYIKMFHPNTQHSEIIKGCGIVYEACISSIFNQVPDNTYKSLYDINFTTSTHTSKMAAKITYLAEKQTSKMYQKPPVTTDIREIHLYGTQQDWDMIMKMYNTAIDMFPRDTQKSIQCLQPWLNSFVQQAPSFQSVSTIIGATDGIMTINFPREHTTICSGFVGCTLDQKLESAGPNIAWYVTRPEKQVNKRASSVMHYYQE